MCILTLLCHFDESGPLMDGSMSTLFDKFDAARANCFLSKDRHHLLAVIEAGFGDINAFNYRVQAVVLAL